MTYRGEAKLGVECQMTNPPRPVGIGVLGEGREHLASVTLDNFRQCAVRLDELEAAIPTSSKYAPKSPPMVRRVARALCKAAGYDPDTTEDICVHGDPESHYLWAKYRVRARAAIEAMREPTELMISEGESACSLGIGKPCDDEALPRVWRDMVDAALHQRS